MDLRFDVFPPLDIDGHRNFVKRGKLLGMLGNISAIHVMLNCGIYMIVRVISGVCYTGCIRNFPLIVAIAVLLMPLFLSVLMGCKWWVAVILEVISISSLFISHFLHFATPNVNSMLQSLILFIVYIIGLYSIHYSKACAFKQRENLMRLVSEEAIGEITDLLNVFTPI
jgi:hypothetical protein